MYQNGTHFNWSWGRSDYLLETFPSDYASQGPQIYIVW